MTEISKDIVDQILDMNRRILEQNALIVKILTTARINHEGQVEPYFKEFEPRGKNND